MQVRVQEIPCQAIEKAVESSQPFREIPDGYSMTIEEDDNQWSFIFLSLNRRWRGGDVEVRIAKDTLAVVEVIPGQ